MVKIYFKNDNTITASFLAFFQIFFFNFSLLGSDPHSSTAPAESMAILKYFPDLTAWTSASFCLAILSSSLLRSEARCRLAARSFSSSRLLASSLSRRNRTSP